MIRRRTLLSLGIAEAMALPGAARAQQPGRTYRLGRLTLTAPSDAPLRELARAGFVVGRNLVLDEAVTTPQELAAQAARIVAANPDAIFAGGDSAARAALAATRTIPIVTISDNLQSSGLLASFARPEGNLTGVNIFANELNGKRQELLIELMPELRRLAILADPATAGPEGVDTLVKAANARAISCAVYRADAPDGIASAIGAARADGAQAVNVLASPLFHGRHADIIAQLADARLPAIFQWPDYVQEGALIAYGPRLESIYGKLIAQQLIRILRGARPADVPAEQPTDFRLGINLRTAKTLGLAVSPAILARADEVIE